VDPRSGIYSRSPNLKRFHLIPEKGNLWLHLQACHMTKLSPQKWLPLFTKIDWTLDRMRTPEPDPLCVSSVSRKLGSKYSFCSEKQGTLICYCQNMPSSQSTVIGPFLGEKFDALLEPELQGEHESCTDESNHEPGEGRWRGGYHRDKGLD
jgi:hypothetical protein